MLGRIFNWIVGGNVYRKFDSYSVEFDRGFVGLLALGADEVAMAAVGACASILLPGLVWYWVVGDTG